MNASNINCSVCRTNKIRLIDKRVTSSHCWPIYDEHHKKYHHHKTEVTVLKYKCFNGHIFIKRIRYVCWCGWPYN